jgi:hypothetical protein
MRRRSPVTDPKGFLQIQRRVTPYRPVEERIKDYAFVAPEAEVGLVRDFLAIDEPVGQPKVVHPKRPIEGFGCTRSEVSGRRFWGWARDRYRTPARFAAACFVVNYCPLVFMEESGANRTPDKLPAAEREPLFDVCDEALRRLVAWCPPARVVGVGSVAAARADSFLARFDADRDGVVVRTEASRIVRDYSFSILDADGDGRITRDEALRAMRGRR